MSVDRSRELRRNSTEPERKLWTLLRSLKPLNFHFRRQVPVGWYYADFACHHARLIIEVDGDTHGTEAAMAYDQARDGFLRSAGYEVLRVSNDDVMQNLEGVWLVIEQALKGRTTLTTPTRLPPPSPQGGGGRAADTEPPAPSSPSPLRAGSDEPSMQRSSGPLPAKNARSAARAGLMGGGREDGTSGAGQRLFCKGNP